ncbi:perilipin-3-like isoform X2 [Ornithorhynchus anatinus]|uniref:perilipin-3-like isoform X2 n=1 Tax=Ornithorhynchus anatinus TaxID=9258 RepID=UPI0010A85015|nr:perilipin-3-like isoform X2 [Ornithorhynchus anatinus]
MHPQLMTCLKHWAITSRQLKCQIAGNKGREFRELSKELEFCLVFSVGLYAVVPIFIMSHKEDRESIQTLKKETLEQRHPVMETVLIPSQEGEKTDSQDAVSATSTLREAVPTMLPVGMKTDSGAASSDMKPLALKSAENNTISKKQQPSPQLPMKEPPVETQPLMSAEECSDNAMSNQVTEDIARESETDTTKVSSSIAATTSGETDIISMPPNAGQLPKPEEKLVLTESDYLPIPEEELAKLAEFESEVPSKEERRPHGYFVRLGSLSSQLQPQAYKHSLEKIRCAKLVTQETLFQLYRTIDLIDCTKGSAEKLQKSQEQLHKLWLMWCKSQSGEVMHSGSPLQIETRTLAMSCDIALRLQSAFSNLMPSIQGLPDFIQEKFQKACHNMEELHTLFSMSNSFQDLTSSVLIQSQEKLTKARKNLEELLFYVEDTTPHTWLVGPYMPSKCSFTEQNPVVVASPEESKEVLH